MAEVAPPPPPAREASERVARLDELAHRRSRGAASPAKRGRPQLWSFGQGEGPHVSPVASAASLASAPAASPPSRGAWLNPHGLHAAPARHKDTKSGAARPVTSGGDPDQHAASAAEAVARGATIPTEASLTWRRQPALPPLPVPLEQMLRRSGGGVPISNMAVPSWDGPLAGGGAGTVEQLEELRRQQRSPHRRRRGRRVASADELLGIEHLEVQLERVGQASLSWFEELVQRGAEEVEPPHIDSSREELDFQAPVEKLVDAMHASSDKRPSHPARRAMAMKAVQQHTRSIELQTKLEGIGPPSFAPRAEEPKVRDIDFSRQTSRVQANVRRSMHNAKRSILGMKQGRTVMNWLQDSGMDTLDAQARIRAKQHNTILTAPEPTLVNAKPPKQEMARVVLNANPAAINPTSAAAETQSIRDAAQDLHERVGGDEKAYMVHAKWRASSQRAGVAWSRPFFTMGELPKTRYIRAPVAEDDVKAVEVRWELKTSVFNPRPKECDARAFFDSERIRRKRLELDWGRVCEKKRFMKLVSKADADVAKGGSQIRADEQLMEEMGEIKEAFWICFKTICAAYQYFCMAGTLIGEAAYSMTFNQWNAFVRDCELEDNNVKGCRGADLDTMFVSTNFEEDKDSQAAEENDDNALMRFEFLEILVRVAIARYIQTRQLDDVSEAVLMLCNKLVLPNLCEEALVVPDTFRRERMYFQEVEQVLLPHLRWLRGIYCNFVGMGTTNHFMEMEPFFKLWDSFNLVNAVTGISRNELKLIFGWSTMQPADELKRERLCGLAWIDFIESVCRVAELLSTPGEDTLQEFFHETNEQETPYAIAEYYDKVPEQLAETLRRGSADLMKPGTRPLSVKLEGLLEVMSYRLMRNWGDDTPEFKEVIRRLETTAKSRGVDPRTINTNGWEAKVPYRGPGEDLPAKSPRAMPSPRA